MTFEEKILGYLDDTLPEEEREAVLHEAHSSRDARALLDAHVRLGSLYALTAKPISAPLDIQRELAAKVPILAVKLPYLATPEKRRKGVVAWFWDSKLNILLLLLAALLGAGIWYVGSKSERGTNSQPLPATKNSSANQSRAVVSGNKSVVSPDRNSIPSNSSAAGNTVHTIGPSTATPPSARLDQSTRSSFSQAYGEHSGELGASRSNRGESVVARAGGFSNLSSKNVNAKNESVQDIAAEPAVKEPTMVTDTFLLPPLRAVSIPPSIAALHSAAIPIPIASLESNNSYTPLQAFVEENIRSTSIAPQAKPTDFARKYGVWQTSILSEAEEFGIDYELSPRIAIGVRGGNARFIQAQPVVHSVPVVGSYGHLSHTIIETALLDPFAPWACVAGTYVVHSAGQLQYELTAGGGNVFLNGFSPTALGEAAATYRISNAMALRASISYQASWTTTASSIVLNNTSQSIVSGAAVFSTSPKLFASQAFGFSIGVAIHP